MTKAVVLIGCSGCGFCDSYSEETLDLLLRGGKCRYVPPAKVVETVTPLVLERGLIK